MKNEPIPKINPYDYPAGSSDLVYKIMDTTNELIRRENERNEDIQACGHSNETLCDCNDSTPQPERNEEESWIKNAEEFLAPLNASEPEDSTKAEHDARFDNDPVAAAKLTEWLKPSKQDTVQEAIDKALTLANTTELRKAVKYFDSALRGSDLDSRLVTALVAQCFVDYLRSLSD